MDPRCSPGRAKINLHFNSKAGGEEGYRVQFYKAKRYGQRRGSRVIGEASYRNSSRYPVGRGNLQHLLHSDEEGRGIPPNSKLEKTEPEFRYSTLQDGDISKHPTGANCRGLGYHHRFGRCLFSPSNILRTQKVPEVYFSESSLPIPCTSIRPGGGSTDFYQSISGFRGVPETSANSYFYVSRRLACQESMRNNPYKSEETNFRDTKGIRSLVEQEKIFTGALAGSNISRGDLRPSVGDGISISTKVRKLKGEDRFFQKVRGGQGQRIFKASRSNDCMPRTCPKSSYANETHSIPSPELVEGEHRLFREDGASERGANQSPRMVEGGEEFLQGRSSEICRESGPLDRRFRERLGGPSRILSSTRRLDPDSEYETHKLARAKGSPSSSRGFSPACKRKEYPDKDGQLHCCRIHQQGGGDKINASVSSCLGDSTMGRFYPGKPESCSHSREEEYCCRQSIEGPGRTQIDRMVPEQRYCQTDLSNIRCSKHRLVCDTGKQTTSSVLFPLADRGRLALRCPEHELDGNVRLRISPPDLITSNFVQDQERTLHSYPNRPAGSESILVPSPARSDHRLSEVAPQDRGFIDSKQRPLDSPRPSRTEAGGLENLGNKEETNFLSEKARKYISESRRPSTRKMYGARQRIFNSWCTERNICPSSASIMEVADFLIFLHEEKRCKASTLTGYRAAISDIHEAWGTSTVSTNKLLSKLIKGIFHTNPTSNQLLPNWDLPLVLEALTKPPFEPLRSIELKFLSWKTVFLLALASAARVSELHALSTNEACFRVEVSGIRLFPKLKFLAKNQRANKAWSSWFIPDFKKHTNKAKDLVLCPCRCLKVYLERTRDIRVNEEALFITYQEGKNNPASKCTIARWIVSTIKQAYESCGTPYPENFRAHDTRKLAVSWALFNGASLKEILQAAHWSQENSFTSFYLKDVSKEEGNFARASIMGTIDDRGRN